MKSVFVIMCYAYYIYVIIAFLLFSVECFKIYVFIFVIKILPCRDE